MGDWRMARSLDKLLEQINDTAPNRSKASDGGIADAAHRKPGSTSDHVERRFPWADKPVVLARDFTHDLKGGLDCQRLYTSLVESHDPRIRYVIWRRHITSGAAGPAPWVARDYSGANPHDRHLHLSVVGDARADSAIPWTLKLTIPTPWRRWPTIRRGDSGESVKLIQRWLGVVEADDPGYGVFGARTDAAVRNYQRMRGLTVDGIVGPATYHEMGLV